MATQALGTKGPIHRSSSNPVLDGAHPWRVSNSGDGFTVANPVLVTNALSGVPATVTGLTGTLAAGTKVWLKTNFASGVPTSYEVTTTGPMGADLYTFEGAPFFRQTGGWELIGEVASGPLPAGVPGFNFTIGPDSLHFRQQINTVLEQRVQCVNGRATWRNVAR